jgi:hypothetical protein
MVIVDLGISFKQQPISKQLWEPASSLFLLDVVVFFFRSWVRYSTVIHLATKLHSESKHNRLPSRLTEKQQEGKGRAGGPNCLLDWYNQCRFDSSYYCE